MNSEGYGLLNCNWSSHTSLVLLDRIGTAENQLDYYLKSQWVNYNNVFKCYYSKIKEVLPVTVGSKNCFVDVKGPLKLFSGAWRFCVLFFPNVYPKAKQVNDCTCFLFNRIRVRYDYPGELLPYKWRNLNSRGH